MSPVEWGLIATMVAVALFVFLEAIGRKFDIPTSALLVGVGTFSLAVALWCGMAFAAARIARRKGYSFRKYFIVTLAGGVLALAGVLALPDLTKPARKGLASDTKGIVTVEAALILTLVMLPVGLAIAKWEKPLVAWVTTTAGNLERNSALQEENNRLLKALIEKQGEAPAPAPTPSPTPTGPLDPVGTDPRPKYVPDDEYGHCPSGYARNNGVCTLL